jgi:hypothetical protein
MEIAGKALRHEKNASLRRLLPYAPSCKSAVLLANKVSLRGSTEAVIKLADRMATARLIYEPNDIHPFLVLINANGASVITFSGTSSC